jgi:hypothetical protein
MRLRALSTPRHSLLTKDRSVASHHARPHRSLLALPGAAVTVACLCMGSTLSAADAPQTPTSHSLIHRQNQQPASAERGPATPIPGTTGAPSISVPPRKLTKRPNQASTVKPSTAPATSPTTVTPLQPAPASSISRPVTESRTSIAATGLAVLGSSLLNTTPVTNGGANAASSTAAPASAAKAPRASALGAGGAPSPSSAGVAGGRSLQRLTTQLPGLTDLMAPTVSISSPPSGPQQSQSQSPSPPPSSPPPTSPPPAAPPATGSATLSWSLNSESDLAGYKVYVGTAPGLYTYPGSPFVVGLTGNYTINGLPSGQTYYFAVSAFDSSGSESGLSSEVSKSIH